jgi:hypothetical protein
MGALPQEGESPAAVRAPAEQSPAVIMSQEEKSPAPPLSHWLQLMLAEIARKREELESARAEAARRDAERGAQHPGGSEA